MNDSTKSGVYKITCTANGKAYIGSALDILRRWRKHRLDASRGQHKNIRIQNAWNKYGASVFVFEVMEHCEPQKLVEREQFWMDSLDVTNPDKGFNIKLLAYSSLGLKSSPETRAKLSEALKGKPAHNKGKKPSPETIAKIVAKTTGSKRTPEARARMSAAQKGKHSCPPEVRARISASLTGKKQSPETIEKHKLAQRGEKNASSKLTEGQVLAIRKRFAEGGILQRELAEQFNVTQVMISRIILRAAWKHI